MEGLNFARKWNGSPTFVGFGFTIAKEELMGTAEILKIRDLFETSLCPWFRQGCLVNISRPDRLSHGMVCVNLGYKVGICMPNFL